MTVWCVGSVNVDHVYAVPHLVAPGETLTATARATSLGGKGANQSVAAARLHAEVIHVGAVGPDGAAVLAEMAEAGVDVSRVGRVDDPTGHAIIQVDAAGENAIVVFAGANARIDAFVAAGLDGIAPGDVLLLQNEGTGGAQAARIARHAGARVLYSAAPFDATAAREMLPHADLLLLNEGEAAALSAEAPAADLPDRVVTRGARGAVWHIGDMAIEVPAHPAPRVVDTTGAGDCVAGALACGLDAMPDAWGDAEAARDILETAMVAASFQVAKEGAAKAMPTLAMVKAVRG